MNLEQMIEQYEDNIMDRIDIAIEKEKSCKLDYSDLDTIDEMYRALKKIQGVLELIN